MKPLKKPMKKPMMSAGFCLKEDDMMKFCISDSSLDSKLAIAEQSCNEDSSSGNIYIFFLSPSNLLSYLHL